MPKLTSIRSRQPSAGHLASVWIVSPIQDCRITSAAASRSAAGRLPQSSGPPAMVLVTRRASSRSAGMRRERRLDDEDLVRAGRLAHGQHGAADGQQPSLLHRLGEREIPLPALVFHLDVLDRDGVAARVEFREGLELRHPAPVDQVPQDRLGLLVQQDDGHLLAQVRERRSWARRGRGPGRSWPRWRSPGPG